MAQDIKENVVIKKFVIGAQTPDVTSGKGINTKLSNSNSSYFNADVSQLRQAGSDLEAIRQLARVNGDVSATVSAMVRCANTEIKYRVFDATHQLSPDGYTLLMSILNRLETQFDYSTGFDNRQSVKGVVETLLRSVVLTGAAAAELTLDKARLPYALKTVSVEKVLWVVSTKADGVNQGLFPRVKGSKGDIDLDIPTFLYASLDHDPTSAYSYSPLEPSTGAAIFHAEVIQDLRRVVTRTGHSRLLVTLDYEQLIKSAPLELRGESVKLSAWVEGVRSNIASEIEKLSPESALVTFSSVTAEYLASTVGGGSDYTGLIGIIDSVLATSLKIPMSCLGKGNGTQNSSSVESLLFIKQCAGLHAPVETVLSRALTLACRLVGFDGYVRANFSDINLRPSLECESFISMAQAKILERLSLGFITDSEAAQELGTGPLSPEFQPLSGTGFYGASATGGVDTLNVNDAAGTRAVSTDKKKPSPKAAGGKDSAARK